MGKSDAGNPAEGGVATTVSAFQPAALTESTTESAVESGAAPAPGDFSEAQLDSCQVFRGRLLDVRRDRVRLPDGATTEREYIVHSGAVAILPLLDEHTVLLEYQFRYPNRQHYYEIPAGKLEPGEAPLLAAQRELEEETGYRAAEWRELATLHQCIAYSTERIIYYVAHNFTYTQPRLDPGEFLATMALPLEQAWRWIESGRINDAKTVAGLLWWKSFSSNGGG